MYIYLTFSGAEKVAKRHPPPPSRPLYWADVIDSRQKPPSINFLVWLSSLCPKGVAIIIFRLAHREKPNLLPC